MGENYTLELEIVCIVKKNVARSMIDVEWFYKSKHNISYYLC